MRCPVCLRDVPANLAGDGVGFHYTPGTYSRQELAVCPGCVTGGTIDREEHEHQRTLAYVRGYSLADDERQRERKVWVALLLACAVAAYSVGRYLVAPRVLSCPPPAAYRVVRCGGLAPVTPGNLTPDGGPVQ
jgi:hypothetical protein